MKKIFLLSVLMLLPMLASADAVEINGIYYNLLEGDIAEVTKMPNNGKYSGSIVIPETVEYDGENYCVTSIGWGAFFDCSGLTSVTIPNSVTSIGDHAFTWCSGLTSITIPNSVTSICQNAFVDCSGLTSIKVESDNPKYDSRDNCNAIIETSSNTIIAGCKNTIILNSVTSIGGCAFAGCSGLSFVTIPSSVTSIGYEAFSDCGLTSIEVESDNPKYDSRDNCNAIIETSSNTLIAGFKSTIIPNSVTSIGVYAFSFCRGLTSITIPNSVTSIGENAFQYCSGLTSVTIPNSVTSIGKNAFQYCSGLTSVTIPNSVTSIGWGTFSDCSGLTSVTIPNSVTSIGGYAFSGCSGLISVTIPNSVTSIGESAFSGCSGLTSVTIPNSVTSIGSDAFRYCYRLTEVSVDLRTPLVINSSCFLNRANATLFVPAGSKAAYQVANYWKDFKEIVEAEGSNTSTKRTIHVATAGTLADYISEADKYTIEELTLTGELNGTDFRLLRDMAGNNYLGQKTDGRLTVLDLSNATIVAGGDKYLDTNSIKGNGVSASGSFHYSISDNNIFPQQAFSACNLKIVSIPYSVTSIEHYAFEFCSDLTSVSIPKSVISIRGNAFSNCTGLTSIKVESGNSKYDSRNNCNAIIETSSNTLIAGCKNTIIPNSVTSIDQYAFYGCSSLTSMTIPNSVTSIGNSAFSACFGLTSIIIPSSVTSIGHLTFKGCSLTSLTIPNSVTSIGSGAFDGCSSLTEVSVDLTTPLTIDHYTFSNRANATLFVPAGSKAAYQAADYWKDFKMIVEDNGVTNLSQMDNAIYIEMPETWVGATVDLSVKMKNTLTPVGCSFMLALPAGMQLAKDNAGDIIYTLSDRANKMNVTMVDRNDGSYNIALTPSTGTATIKGNNDTFITFRLQIPNNMTAGEYKLYVTDCLIQSNANGTTMDYAQSDMVTPLTVKDYKMGDVNGDDGITPSDAIMTLYYFFNVPQTGFNPGAADINGDGKVTPADAIEMLYIFFGVSNPNASRQRVQQSPEELLDPQ